jgi:hypothetical protein
MNPRCPEDDKLFISIHEETQGDDFDVDFSCVCHFPSVMPLLIVVSIPVGAAAVGQRACASRDSLRSVPRGICD